MRQKTNKLKALESKRFSVFTDDLSHCYFCSKPRTDLHELLPGRNRLNSMKYGFVLPLCREHHTLMHSSETLIEEYKVKCELYWIHNIGSKDEWISVFKKNYL